MVLKVLFMLLSTNLSPICCSVHLELVTISQGITTKLVELVGEG